MSAYLLDTSAVVAHYRKEVGHARVQALFDDDDAVLWIAAPSLLELDTCLRDIGIEETVRRQMVNDYMGELIHVVTVDGRVARRAMASRDAAERRLPAMYALIAACAVVCGAVLVHRDAHFDTIPLDVLPSLRLSEQDDGIAMSAIGSNRVKEARAAYKTGRARRKVPAGSSRPQ
ncbi:MAG: PIN domain-containing protein [bacterium]